MQCKSGNKQTNHRLHACKTLQDMQATTPLDPRVLDVMMPWMLQRYGNPHSRTHSYGWEAEAAVEVARAQVASLIGASPREVSSAAPCFVSLHICSVAVSSISYMSQ
jgi:cysteine sulfinate desulfinase/cysteine desulfurase-like protein